MAQPRRVKKILAFPCNEFMNQEPGTSEEAEQFVYTRFKAEYPIFQKEVNFTKFLVHKDGQVIKLYGTNTSPSAITDDIKKEI